MTAAILANFTPLPDQADAVQAILQRMVGFTRAESGCLVYDLYRTPSGFLLHEIYVDAAALEAHRAASYFADYRRDIGARLAEPIRVETLAALDADVLRGHRHNLLGG